MIKKHSHGFTLIELMFTVAIAAIVLSFGVPNLQIYLNNNQKKTAINDLRTALSLARNTAITRRERTTVCKSANLADCTDDGDWSQGWIVFTDPSNRDTVDDGEITLRVHEAIAGDANFTGDDVNGDPTSVSNRVSFTPQGMSDASLGSINYTDSANGENFTGSLIISFGGLVRSE
jgi:type IV fimbrial biogenesis protein FimT